MSATGTNQTVCDDQKKFNEAFKKAIIQADEDMMEKSSGWIVLYTLLYLVFIVWAIILAMRMPESPGRVVHLVLAMAFAPFYVLAYYLRQVAK